MTSSKRTPVWRTPARALASVLVSVLAALATIGLAGCQLSAGGPDDLGHAWVNTCPEGKQVAAEVDPDVSGSSAESGVSGPFEQALRDRAARVAMCGGRLRASAFSGSNAGTVTLYDGAVPIKGSTTNAKARRIPDAVDAVVSAVKQRFPLDSSVLAPGSDIVSQLVSAQQYATQLGSGYVLDLVIVTDGLDNKTLPTTQILDKTSAAKAAQEVSVPKLPGAWVTIVGLGETAGQPVDSSVTDALTVFYSEICKRTGAARCTVAIDYVSPVGG